jgi:hypothetical protein
MSCIVRGGLRVAVERDMHFAASMGARTCSRVALNLVIHQRCSSVVPLTIPVQRPAAAFGGGPAASGGLEAALKVGSILSG